MTLTEQQNNNGKVVFITGGSGRIGAQTARRLHQSGMNVVIHYRNSRQNAEKLQQELNAIRTDSVKLVQADLNDNDVYPRLIQQVIDQFGRLDVLINNASSFYPTPVGQITLQHWDDLINSNMKAPLFVAQAAASELSARQGCIINLVDIHAQRPLAEHTVYCMAKAANAMLVKSLARELAPAVRVNGVAPGAIAWPDMQTSAALDEKSKQMILQRVPMQRKGEFDDIAKTIRFLVSDAPYITGQIIAVDGGRTTQQ